MSEALKVTYIGIYQRGQYNSRLFFQLPDQPVFYTGLIDNQSVRKLIVNNQYTIENLQPATAQQISDSVNILAKAFGVQEV